MMAGFNLSTQHNLKTHTLLLSQVFWPCAVDHVTLGSLSLHPLPFTSWFPWVRRPWSYTVLTLSFGTSALPSNYIICGFDKHDSDSTAQQAGATIPPRCTPRYTGTLTHPLGAPGTLSTMDLWNFSNPGSQRTSSF